MGVEDGRRGVTASTSTTAGLEEPLAPELKMKENAMVDAETKARASPSGTSVRGSSMRRAAIGNIFNNRWGRRRQWRSHVLVIIGDNEGCALRGVGGRRRRPSSGTR